MTAGNLRSAFGGESMAHLRYIVWGAKARREGFPNIARLFDAISAAEQVHATNHFQAMSDVGGAFAVTSAAGFGLGATRDNLIGALEGERFEINEMYPAYIEVAINQMEKSAERSFGYAIAAEKVHAEMFEKALAAIDSGEDIALGPVQICVVCGHTLEGDAPDNCPVCGAIKAKYRAFA
jgi:rubrerythrin